MNKQKIIHIMMGLAFGIFVTGCEEDVAAIAGESSSYPDHTLDANHDSDERELGNTPDSNQVGGPSDESTDKTEQNPGDSEQNPGESEQNPGESEHTEGAAHHYAPGEAMTNVTARRVAKKINFWGKKEIADGFEAFDVEDADYGVLHTTRIAEIADPDVHKTVMFMTAGQKAPVGGHPNGLTGQAPDWDDQCDDEKCSALTLDARSLAMKLRALNWFPKETTWLALAPDNNFDYTATQNKRRRLATGFFNWLKSKITDDTENVVLAGTSRGGCLSMLFAQELRRDPQYDHIQIYVMSFDGVCHKGDELETSSDKIVNPVRESGTYYGGWAVDMNAQFPNHENLHIFHVSGGEEVVTMTGVRTFSAYEGSKPPETGTDIDWGWYKQNWVRWKHREIGTPYIIPPADEQDLVVEETIDAQLWWLENLLKP